MWPAGSPRSAPSSAPPPAPGQRGRRGRGDRRILGLSGLDRGTAARAPRLSGAGHARPGPHHDRAAARPRLCGRLARRARPRAQRRRPRQVNGVDVEEVIAGSWGYQGSIAELLRARLGYRAPAMHGLVRTMIELPRARDYVAGWLAALGPELSAAARARSTGSTWKR